MSNNRKQVVSFTIEPELEQYLRDMANREHLSISQYLRNLIWSGYEVQKTIDEENNNVDEIVEKWISEGKCKRLPDGRLAF